MNQLEQFDNACRYLGWVALDCMRTHGHSVSVFQTIDAFNAIEYVGLYMGSPRIEYLYADASAILGDRPTLEVIAEVLGAAKEFREGDMRVSWLRRIKRWALIKAVYRKISFRYPER